MSYEQQPMPPHAQQQMGLNPGYNMYQPMPANMHPHPPYPQFIQPLAMPIPPNMAIVMAPQPVLMPHVMVPLPLQPPAMQNMPHYSFPYNNGNHVHHNNNAPSAAQMNLRLQNEATTSPPEQSMPKMKPEPKKPEPMPMPTPKAKRNLVLELTANCVVPKNKSVEGLLYDPEFLDAAQLEANNYLMADNWYDDYDHMRDTTPPIEGVCFHNPFYSTEPKIPKKPRHHRQHHPSPVPYTKPSPSGALAQGLPQFPSPSGLPQFPSPSGLPQFPSPSGLPQFPSPSGLPHFPSPSLSPSPSHWQLPSLHRLINANDVNGHGPSMTPWTESEEQWHINGLEEERQQQQQEAKNQNQLDELELDATTAAFEAMQFPGNNAAAARSRRQRRNRCRGLTQSFGIVAPVLPNNSGNRSNNNNQAVNDVMSLFDGKPVEEKMPPAAEVNPNNGLPEQEQGEWPLLFIPNRSEGNVKSTSTPAPAKASI
ncbi:uncharacterized protein LOC133849003 [Drosophila sulfurigaster albostrigata]|uniref:uncharacterized protein LOC133849003 n=1 Tax=Drosophila sulfurigaster albostrigata TaxID=89887 RepID=UPI002D21AA15|nr:uncharacterized protein LOC133849003 [Drosophila sulfurigaster albostrigata]XP_062140789.1 uncharacterized protein LOC133849003 [Drosophila sulfurigaster albostrigata]